MPITMPIMLHLLQIPLKICSEKNILYSIIKVANSVILASQELKLFNFLEKTVSNSFAMNTQPTYYLS